MIRNTTSLFLISLLLTLLVACTSTTETLTEPPVVQDAPTEPNSERLTADEPQTLRTHDTVDAIAVYGEPPKRVTNNGMAVAGQIARIDHPTQPCGLITGEPIFETYSLATGAGGFAYTGTSEGVLAQWINFRSECGNSEQYLLFDDEIDELVSIVRAIDLESLTPYEQWPPTQENAAIDTTDAIPTRITLYAENGDAYTTSFDAVEVRELREWLNTIGQREQTRNRPANERIVFEAVWESPVIPGDETNNGQRNYEYLQVYDDNRIVYQKEIRTQDSNIRERTITPDERAELDKLLTNLPILTEHYGPRPTTRESYPPNLRFSFLDERYFGKYTTVWRPNQTENTPEYLVPVRDWSRTQISLFG